MMYAMVANVVNPATISVFQEAWRASNSKYLSRRARIQIRLFWPTIRPARPNCVNSGRITLVLLCPSVVFRPLGNFLGGVCSNTLGFFSHAKKSLIVHLCVHWRPSSDLLLDRGNAIAWIRVVAEKIRTVRAALLLQCLKKLGKFDRRVADLVHQDRPDAIRLRFVPSRILQRKHSGSDADAQAGQRSRCAIRLPEHGAKNADQALLELLLLHLLDRMLHVHVRNLVCHDTGELRFIRSSGNRPDVDENGAAGQCKCVDLFLGNNVELVWPGSVRRNHRHQFLAELLNILRLGASESGKTGICLYTSAAVCSPS